MLPSISEQSAALLATAILDNTLNFTGQMTTAADIEAYAELALHGKLTADWPEQYFLECQATIESDMSAALAADLKRMKPESRLPEVFAQMTVWDADALIEKHRSEICRWMGGQGDDWLLNLISLSEGRSYLLTGSPGSARKLERLLECSAQDGVHCLARPILRKELLRKGLALQAVP